MNPLPRLIRLAVAANFAVALSVTLAQVDTTVHSLDPPSARAVLSATASGVQIYSCEYDAHHALNWVFDSPRALLRDATGDTMIWHSAGPAWQARDGSRIVGRLIAQIPSQRPGSIAQLLLDTHSTGTPGVLSRVRYVKRMNTEGGMMPARSCTLEHETADSPYRATYVFFE